jgi:hypothetical protein
MVKKKEELDGVWRTIGGRRVFIKKGQSLSDAMRESGKFKKIGKLSRREYQVVNLDNENDNLTRELQDEFEKTKKRGQEITDNKKLLELSKKISDNQERRGDINTGTAGRYYDEEKAKKLDGKHIEGKKEERESISDSYKVYEEEDGYSGKGSELLKFIKAEEEDSGEKAPKKLIDQLKNNPDKEYVFDNNDNSLREINKSKYQPKEIEYTGQDGKTHKMNSYEYPEEREEYHKYLQDKYGTYKEEEIKNNNGRTDYKKLREEFYENKKEDEEYKLFKRAKEDPDSIDPMTENSTDWEALDKKYGSRYKTERDNYETRVYGSDVTEADKQMKKVFGEDFKYAEEKEKTKQEKIDDLYDKLQNERNIFKKGEIQEEINMLKDDFKGTKEQYREQVEKEQERRLSEYQKEKEQRQAQIKQEKIDKAVKSANTQKALKSLVDDGVVKDITRLSDEETKKLRNEHGHLEVMRVTHGTYGMNGAILRSYVTGEYFVITSRNGNLFYWV